ncbi:MAG TPA: hypothetical protein PLS28_00065, partial [Clostridiales bacterium]|nr:hypothetical protein [Clostridiales bacterium]
RPSAALRQRESNPLPSAIQKPHNYVGYSVFLCLEKGWFTLTKEKTDEKAPDISGAFSLWGYYK